MDDIDELTAAFNRQADDIRLFEKKIKMEYDNMDKVRRQYQGVLTFLVLMLLVSLYNAFSCHAAANTTLLSCIHHYLFVVVAAMLLFLFFQLGVWRMKVREPVHFFPHLNKVLHHYHLLFDPASGRGEGEVTGLPDALARAVQERRWLPPHVQALSNEQCITRLRAVGFPDADLLRCGRGVLLQRVAALEKAK